MRNASGPRNSARARVPRAFAPRATACALRAQARRIWAAGQRARTHVACARAVRDRMRAACACVKHRGKGTAPAHACRVRPRHARSHARCGSLRDASGPRDSARARVPRAFAMRATARAPRAHARHIWAKEQRSRTRA
eukprot:2892800-Pleurochrysis_carterae.AAC.1